MTHRSPSRAVTPDADRFRLILRSAGLLVDDGGDSGGDDRTMLLLRGFRTDAGGRLAATHRITLLERSSQQASLEQDYLQITAAPPSTPAPRRRSRRRYDRRDRSGSAAGPPA